MEELEYIHLLKEQQSLRNSIVKEQEEHGRKRFATIVERI
jgi:hypothetical protein